MYFRHFGLTAEPFALIPDPGFLYLSPGHAEALAVLKVGLLGRRGLLLMSGEVGAGKTTLLYSLITQLGDRVRAAYLSNTKRSFDDLLRHALAAFGVPVPAGGRTELLDRLNRFLLDCAKSGGTAALVIDEAQNLDDDTFEHLRLLSNCEAFSRRLLQIVLVGRPELEAKLRRRQLRQIDERVAVRCHLGPLSRRESERYIAHRLQRVRGSLALFTPAARAWLAHGAHGLPRRLNIISHIALLFAYGRGLTRVTLPVAMAAVRSCERHRRGVVASPAARWPRVTLAGLRPRWGWLRPALAGVALLATAGGVASARRLNPGLWERTRPYASAADAREAALRQREVAIVAALRGALEPLEAETEYRRDGEGAYQ